MGGGERRGMERERRKEEGGGVGEVRGLPNEREERRCSRTMRRSNDLMQEIHNGCISLLYPPGLLRFLPCWILLHLIKKALFHKQVGLVKQSSKATEQQRLIPQGAVKEKTKEVEAQKRK